MKKLLLRVGTVALALSVFTALIVNASMTSGCTRTDTAKPDPALPATTTAAPPTTAMSEPAVTANAPPPAAASEAPPQRSPDAPGVSNVGPGALPATKSGRVFHPKPQPQAPPQQQAPNAAPVTK